jgi:hypothetical protein
MADDLTLAKDIQKAIDKGARTLRAICRRTNRKADQVGRVLTYLTLTARTTRIETRGNTRIYLPRRSQRARFDDAPLSFSSLRGLMPRARSLNLT